MRNTIQALSNARLLIAPLAAALSLSTAGFAAAPGIKGQEFHLTARAAYISQPDGAAIYSWGYGCVDTSTVSFAPSAITTGFCPTMQVPGPTLIVTEGQAVTVTLTNNLPPSVGNTSILFPGFQVTASGGVAGLLAKEAAPGGSVTYTFTAGSPGTRSYYSGTQGDLQVEMGLYGAIIVLPSTTPAACSSGLAAANLAVETAHGEADYRLAKSAYDHPKSCYDREYMYQFSEMDPVIHQQALNQVTALGACTPGTPTCALRVATEPYHPAYFLINGRSMPDIMDPNYAPEHPHQPYNANPHMHPGEITLVRVVGQGRWQHPFHEHANHLRTLGTDGNILLSAADSNDLAGPVLFTTSTVPGQGTEGLFYWTGKGLNWDAYGHNAADPSNATSHPPCVADANGYYTANSGAPASAINYYEWCQDHLKPLEVLPFGDVGAGGPATLPDPNILANGPWYNGSPYLGVDATVRAVGSTGTTPPSGTVVNSPAGEAGFAFMWHSHNEREITTNNIFPGGMLSMMLVDSREFVIDESY